MKKETRKEPLHANAKEHRHFGRSIVTDKSRQRSWDRTPTCRVWYPSLNGHKVEVQNYALCKICHKPFLLDCSGSDICGRLGCQLQRVLLGIRQLAIEKVSGEFLIAYNEAGKNAIKEQPVFLVTAPPKYKKRIANARKDKLSLDDRRRLGVGS